MEDAVTRELSELKAMIERGTRAGRLLGDPLVQDAINDLKETWKNMIFQSDPKDTEARETPYFANLGLESLLGTLTHYQNEKTFAEEALKELYAEEEEENNG